MRITSILMLAFVVSTLAYAAAPTLKSEQEYRQDSQKLCMEEWTKRGELDQRMYSHCMEQQTDAYKDLVHLHGQYANQVFYADIAFPYCRDEWTKRGVADVRMTVYCLNGEVEGMRDVMYFREKHGAERVDQIVMTALAQFNSWGMAAYEVKRHFE